MPNYVINQLRATSAAQFEQIKQIMYQDETQPFSFQRLLPMPSTVRATASTTDFSSYIRLYLIDYLKHHLPREYAQLTSKISHQANKRDYLSVHWRDLISVLNLIPYQNDHALTETFTKAYAACDYNQNKAVSDYIGAGKTLIDNILATGSFDWFDWATRNWGTKWPPGDEVTYNTRANQIIFTTAWGIPTPVYTALAQQVGAFTVAWSDEGGPTDITDFKPDAEPESERLNRLQQQQLSAELWLEEDDDLC